MISSPRRMRLWPRVGALNVAVQWSFHLNNDQSFPCKVSPTSVFKGKTLSFVYMPVYIVMCNMSKCKL
uniref:Uncharacterized protein n=1 Tax=Anguilla anguilla TaxID=7936 RepID=A0A0E9WWQ7_ANGAN